MAVKENWKLMLKAFVTKFKSDLPNFETVDAEIDLWENLWLNNRVKELPSTVEGTMRQMLTTMFPNIFKVLHLLAVLPVTTCSCERSISTLKRVKTYLRNSMTQVRIFIIIKMYLFDSG